ncbi:kojibiose phosphorylase [Clostridium cavendishii DSM 21758]|uniref:Kojibiose phosphorylase n=1 Tax=Clostridium cavendishii DSM 21758 TaxID=1121302 RepID=A0A1M6GVL1_9CLOT|nr:glycoside hydrolase family 65 protein [Clostridium cavendishii]SHJ14001.1 kojibiose phosphorylase [Clostridium cavendishii DSM 21758]
MNSNWIINEKSFNIDKNKYYEGAFCQGNGYLNLRASFEEGLSKATQDELYERSFKSVTTEIQKNPISKWGTYIPTIMGNHPALNEVIINLPYFMEFSFRMDGEKLDMDLSNISEYERILDLQDGVLTREFIWTNKADSCKLKFRYNRFPSMEQKHLFVQKIEVEVLEGTSNLEILSGIDGKVTTNGYNHFVDMNTKIISDMISLRCKTDVENYVMELCKLSSDNVNFSIVKGEKDIRYKGIKQIKKGERYSFEKRSIIVTSRDLEEGDLEKRALILIDAADISYESLYRENKEIWNKKWNESDVKIEGNIKDQLAIRFSIYHLLRSNNEEDPRMAICAKGFAGEAYYGRYFWDTEIFLLPFYIYTNPKAAKNLLMYRYNTLQGAKENAKKYNSPGARYPWQSAIRGDEQCSLWEYADNEIHITADIAYGIWHYFKATNDYEFLINYGTEILFETARFWCSRVDKNKFGGYDLLNVMGPDEYSAMTRNNSFTNRMVKLNLEKAIEALEIVKEKDKLAYEKLNCKLNISKDEIEVMNIIASKLKVIVDKEENYIVQSEDFEDYAEIDIDGLWKDKNKPFGFFVTQEKLYRSKCLKQADALALAMLFKREFTEEQILNTYRKYEPITTHDSSLSPVNHAIVAAWIEDKEHLDKFTEYALNLDFNSDLKGAEEGIHIANCGCLWQLIMNGIAGIDTAINEGTVKSSRVKLPKDWTKVEFKLRWQEKTYKVEALKDNVFIKEA